MARFLLYNTQIQTPETSKLRHGNPEILEQQRIEEIRNLSYQERLERLFALLELSNMLSQAEKIENSNRRV